MATRSPEAKVAIQKYGRGMNSLKLEWRYMYLYVDPFDSDDLDVGIRRAVDAINQLLAIWEPPFRRGVFRRDPWWMYKPCQYCLRRQSMCVRHWAVYHFNRITPYEPFGLLTDQSISIVADNKTIQFNTETTSYRYNVRLDKELAEMEVNYKGKTYKFTYSNHLRGFPHNSNYAYILLSVYETLRLFRDFLADHVQKRRLYSNVVINDTFVLPPSPPDTGNCTVCRL